MTLAGLWLPILASSAAVFFASFLVWMVLPHHRNDWSRVPDEDALLEHLRTQGIGQGNYSFPHCNDPKVMQSPEFQARWEQNPTGFLTLRRAGKFSMGRELGQWAIYTLAISVCVAYVVSRTVGADAAAAAGEHAYLSVFRVAGTTAFLAYSAAVIPQAIWKSLRWSTVWKEVADGLGYALLTAGFFGWLA